MQAPRPNLEPPEPVAPEPCACDGCPEDDPCEYCRMLIEQADWNARVRSADVELDWYEGLAELVGECQ